MSEIEKLVNSLSKGSLSEIFPGEDLVIEAVRDLAKDEIKKYMLNKLNENPEIKAEIKAALMEYMEAKAKEVHAAIRLSKAGAKLGLSLIPKDLKEELSKELVSLVENEVSEVLSKGL